MKFDRSHTPPAIGRLYEGSEPFGHLLEVAMDYAFINTPFSGRIKNALELTAHADSIGSDAIALSLCVAAIEALLCDRHSGRMEQLKLRIPAVLQTDGRLTLAAFNAVQTLYDLRSRCLHGDVNSLRDEGSDYVQAARQLSAAILRAVLEWVACQSDAPERLDDSKWTNELKAATKDSKQVSNISGVSSDLVEHLRGFIGVFAMSA